LEVQILGQENTHPAVWDWERLGIALQKVAAHCTVATQTLHVFTFIKAELGQAEAISEQSSMVQKPATPSRRDLWLLAVVFLLQ